MREQLLSTERARRLLNIHMVWLTVLAALVVRLFWIALVPSLATPAGTERGADARWRMDEEHFHAFMIDDARGMVRFRDGTPWSTPVRESSSHSVASAGKIHVIAPELLGFVGKPDEWPSRNRVVEEQGRGGIEETYDRVLRGRRPGLAGYLAPAPDLSDGQASHPVRGNTHVGAVRYQVEARPGHDVVTTIDHAAQQYAEALLQSHSIRHGSIVDIKLSTRDVLVMASAVHKGRSDALTAVAPGSVYKLISAAAAIDSHAITTQTLFHCDGTVHLAHVNMHCWRAHGALRLVDAIAQSCDTTFAQIGVRVGRQALDHMSSTFGLHQTGMDDQLGVQTIASDRGVVFRTRGSDAGLLANTAIGQEDVRMTPLQGALVASVVAQHGRYQPARLVLGTKRDRQFVALQKPRGHNACSRFAASVLAKGMWDAVHDAKGTLYPLRAFPVAAKSGTAQRLDGRVNAWMVGYRMARGKPVDAFAICVVGEPTARAHRDLLDIARDWLAYSAPLH